MEGEPEFKSWQRHWPKYWYGVRSFFDWLGNQGLQDAHPRAAFRYRAYTDCPACAGARLKTDSLLWRVGSKEQADAALGVGASEAGDILTASTPTSRAALAPTKNAAPGRQRFRPVGMRLSSEALQALPGLSLHDAMSLPIERARDFFRALKIEGSAGDAVDLVMNEIRGRLSYLCEVGLGYLTLDRQSRTLSGGECSASTLTTALGTSLVNTLFVLDEPSIGPAPARHRPHQRRNAPPARRRQFAGGGGTRPGRDAQCRSHRPTSAPAPGAAGGNIVFNGTPAELIASADTQANRRAAPRLAPPPRGAVWARLPTPGAHLRRSIWAATSRSTPV